jgi:hypothetical protein
VSDAWKEMLASGFACKFSRAHALLLPLLQENQEGDLAANVKQHRQQIFKLNYKLKKRKRPASAPKMPIPSTALHCILSSPREQE